VSCMIPSSTPPTVVPFDANGADALKEWVLANADVEEEEAEMEEPVPEGLLA